jgi:allantoinase
LKLLETGDFARAWGGIASLQLLLPVMWHQSNRYEMPVTRLVECLSSAPAKLLGLEKQKGSIEPGKLADLVVFDPDTVWSVKASQLFHRHKTTPYDGVELQGRVVRTYLRGELVFDSGQVSKFPHGRLCQRNQTPSG